MSAAEIRADAHAASRARAGLMAARYRSGETLQQIGASYGITRERVRQLLKRLGVTRYDRGTAAVDS